MPQRTVQLLVFTILFLIKTSLFGLMYTNTILEKELKIKDYKVVIYPAVLSNRTVYITREIITKDDARLYYFIDTKTLRYGMTDSLIRLSNNNLLKNSLLFRLKMDMISNRQAFADAAHTKPVHVQVTNLILTTDLCPIRTNYNWDFFTELISYQKKHNIHIPLVIFFTGRWIQSNPASFQQIRKSGLPFIAGNHTFSHHILKDKYTVAEFEKDVLKNETVLLEKGILPSPFFRFPGLKYQLPYLQALDRMSLLPVDVAIWMGQKVIPDWGVILVHSNGVENVEVQRLKKYLKQQLSSMQSGKLVFKDIYSLFYYWDAKYHKSK